MNPPKKPKSGPSAGDLTSARSTLISSCSNRLRGPSGQWAPGQSGNPAGRPPGTGEVARIRAQIATHVPEIIETLAKAAKAGDTSASRLLLERTAPPYKAVDEATPLALPDGSLTDKGRAVLGAIGAGELPPSQGAAVLSAIGSLARLVEIDELERRLRALEEKAKP